MKRRKRIYILLMVAYLLIHHNMMPVYAYATDEQKNDSMVPNRIVENSMINYEEDVEENWDLLWKNEHKKTTSSFCNDGDNIVETCTLDEEIIFVNDDFVELSAKTVLYAAGTSGSKQEIDYDSVYTIKGYVTIYYTTVDVAGTTCRRLTKVSGGYTWLDNSGSQVTSQSLYYGMTGVGTSTLVNETGSKTPTGTSFSYNTGFTGAINTNGIYALGATYTIYLKRTSSGTTWKLQIECSY